MCEFKKALYIKVGMGAYRVTADIVHESGIM